MDMREREMGLEEFGEFLLKRRIVPEKNAKYYVGWVRKFLREVPDPDDPWGTPSRSARVTVSVRMGTPSS